MAVVFAPCGGYAFWPVSALKRKPPFVLWMVSASELSADAGGANAPRSASVSGPVLCTVGRPALARSEFGFRHMCATLRRAHREHGVFPSQGVLALMHRKHAFGASAAALGGLVSALPPAAGPGPWCWPRGVPLSGARCGSASGGRGAGGGGGAVGGTAPARKSPMPARRTAAGHLASIRSQQSQQGCAGVCFLQTATELWCEQCMHFPESITVKKKKKKSRQTRKKKKQPQTKKEANQFV